MVLDEFGPLLLDVDGALLKTSSSDPLNFSMHAFTDSASILAWAGSYTPQGRSQWASTDGGGLIRSTEDSRRSTMRMGQVSFVQSEVDGARANLTQRRQTVNRGQRPGRFPPWPRVAAAAALATSLALVIVAALVRPRRVVVEGRSMEPTLAPGDRLLVARTRVLHTGDVVAVRDPRDQRRVLVKRIGAVLEEGVVLHGDNPGSSTDSRSFGPVPPSAVLGRVVQRYAPSWRAGPVA